MSIPLSRYLVNFIQESVKICTFIWHFASADMSVDHLARFCPMILQGDFCHQTPDWASFDNFLHPPFLTASECCSSSKLFCSVKTRFIYHSGIISSTRIVQAIVSNSFNWKCDTIVGYSMFATRSTCWNVLWCPISGPDSNCILSPDASCWWFNAVLIVTDGQTNSIV